MSVHFSSKSDEWGTPKDFYNRLNQEHDFTLDPCASAKNHKCKKYFSIEDDGLKQDWGNEVVFCNPPYSALYDWLKKAYNSATAGAKVVMLIPARTDTAAFHSFIAPFAGFESIRKEYAWAAGIVDGEGCIRIDKKNETPSNRLTHPSYALSLGVKMIDRPTVEFLRSLLGEGCLNVEHHERLRTGFRWEVRGEQAAVAIQRIYPWLITKRYQAQLGLEFQEFKRSKMGRRLKPNFLACEEEFYLESSRLKTLQTAPGGLSVKVDFLRGRLKFQGAKHAAPFPSALVIYRPI